MLLTWTCPIFLWPLWNGPALGKRHDRKPTLCPQELKPEDAGQEPYALDDTDTHPESSGPQRTHWTQPGSERN